MIALDDIRARRDDINRVARARGVVNIRVFGSVARGQSDASSDVDLLVDVQPGRSLLDLGGFLADVQRLLGHPVDVVTPAALRDRIREDVLREAVPL